MLPETFDCHSSTVYISKIFRIFWDGRLYYWWGMRIVVLQLFSIIIFKKPIPLLYLVYKILWRVTELVSLIKTSQNSSLATGTPRQHWDKRGTLDFVVIVRTLPRSERQATRSSQSLFYVPHLVFFAHAILLEEFSVAQMRYNPGAERISKNVHRCTNAVTAMET